MMRRPPRSTPFPYPTLFRSHLRHPLRHGPAVGVAQDHAARPGGRGGLEGLQCVLRVRAVAVEEVLRVVEHLAALRLAVRDRRSEEHTSELQSRQYLVCRLLL